MGKMITMLGPDGNFGPGVNKYRGYDIVGTDLGALGNAEWQKVDGRFAANTAKTISFIYAVHDCVPPTIQVNAGNSAAISIKIYACLDRIPRPDYDQDETKDLRAAHWQEITAAYNVFGANGVQAALSGTAAAFLEKVCIPAQEVAIGFRPAFIKTTFTVNGAQPADAIDVFSHATSR